MANVEYCDNQNCRLNAKFSCTVDAIEFDSNGICLTAKYDDKHADFALRDKGTNRDSDHAQEPPPKKGTGGDKDKWIKYI